MLEEWKKGKKKGREGGMEGERKGEVIEHYIHVHFYKALLGIQASCIKQTNILIPAQQLIIAERTLMILN